MLSIPAKVKRLWDIPEKWLPSEWCERAPVYIPANSLNPEPGAYSYGRTPFLRGIIDTVVEPAVREIWFYKPTQVGATRLMVNLIGYWAAQDPGACGLLEPDEDTVEELFAEELKPTIDETPALRALKTARKWDATKDEIWLQTMPIFGLYAGSVQKLARRSLRYILGDEINKYRPFRNEASPILLLKKRTSNWKHRARAVFASSPTTRDGNITVGYESCPDKREYFCRCPHCGGYELWKWSQVKGFRGVPGDTKDERSNYVRLNQPAYYECGLCGKAITEEQKGPAVGRGVWVSGVSENGNWRPTQTVNPDGTLEGERPVSAKVGFHLSALLSPWLSFSDLAAEWIEAEGDLDKSRDFRNARLALPWDEVSKSIRPSIVRDKKENGGPPLIVPRWAVAVYATFDTQKDWFAGVIRAWGRGNKSALLWYGIVQSDSFDEVYRIGLESRLDVEGGGIISPKCLLIDSGGDRTDRVYEFAQRDPRILPTKGMSRRGRKLWYDSNPKPGVTLRLVDTEHYKNVLWALINDPDVTKWLPHADAPEQYCHEMASEHLVRDPKTKQWTWVETGGARNEAWDCEVLQVAAADMDAIALSAPVEPPQKPVTERTANPLDYRGRW